ncbi:unnamed protein product, partial [Vitis vinifera]
MLEEKDGCKSNRKGRSQADFEDDASYMGVPFSTINFNQNNFPCKGTTILGNNIVLKALNSISILLFP